MPLRKLFFRFFSWKDMKGLRRFSFISMYFSLLNQPFDQPRPQFLFWWGVQKDSNYGHMHVDSNYNHESKNLHYLSLDVSWYTYFCLNKDDVRYIFYCMHAKYIQNAFDSFLIFFFVFFVYKQKEIIRLDKISRFFSSFYVYFDMFFQQKVQSNMCKSKCKKNCSF